MAIFNLEESIKRSVEKTLSKPICNGLSVLDWAKIGMNSPRWISVKDRLPETRHAVLVYTPYHKNIWAASMHEDGNWYIWSPGGKVLLDSDWNGPITHWMPLPEPPEEG